MKKKVDFQNKFSTLQLERGLTYKLNYMNLTLVKTLDSVLLRIEKKLD